VVLSVGAHRRVPRRYRGRDFIWWINALGLDDKVIEAGSIRQPPLLISGASGGRTVDLRRYSADGMVLAGRFQDARNGVASFASDLAANLAGGDESYAAFVQAADEFALRLDLALPEQPEPAYPEPVGIETLDLDEAGIGSVIWATGYRYDFGWIDLPVFSADGQPIHRRGVTDVPGAYFLGLQYLHKTKSSFLSGVGEDAAFLAAQIGTSAPNRL
jgi:putative flavoprotein involved in K+ transport